MIYHACSWRHRCNCARCSACYAAAVLTTRAVLGAVLRIEVVYARLWKELAEIQ